MLIHFIKPCEPESFAAPDRPNIWRDHMQALRTHDVGACGQRNLFILATITMQSAATLEPDAASAVVFQLLPTLTRCGTGMEYSQDEV